MAPVSILIFITLQNYKKKSESFLFLCGNMRRLHGKKMF